MNQGQRIFSFRKFFAFSLTMSVFLVRHPATSATFSRQTFRMNQISLPLTKNSVKESSVKYQRIIALQSDFALQQQPRSASVACAAATISVPGWAAMDESGILSPFTFTRRATGPNDVAFKVTHCGICHTDLLQIHNGWKTAKYPMVPGHEMVGIVTEFGSNVENFNVGDHVGVGFLVESCKTCECCKSGQEQYCEKTVWSYNSIDSQGNVTFGGFSSLMVADYRFVVHIPKNLALHEAAPLLCAGITIYSPMKYYKMTEKGKHLGIVGLGGLGHMAVKFGKAFGLETTIISTSPSKQKEAMEVLGADHFLISKDHQQMEEARKSLDFIIDTVSAVHALEPLLSLLKHDGKMVLVGLPEKPLQLNASALIFGGRHTIGASLIGGISETQEMLGFCGEHNLTCMVEIVEMKDVNTAMERLGKSDVRYRFVIDVEKYFESQGKET